MKSIADGFAGLFIFLSNWLSPMEGDGELHLKKIQMQDSLYVIRCEQKFRWNDDATAIIDAGIPLIITFYSEIDGDSQMEFIRVLRSDLERTTYTVLDSTEGAVLTKTEYSNVYLAVRAYKEIVLEVPSTSSEVEILGVLQRSPVSALGKTISLAPICGGERFYRKLVMNKEEK